MRISTKSRVKCNKAFSLLMAFALVFSMTPSAAFAQTASSSSGASTTQDAFQAAKAPSLTAGVVDAYAPSEDTKSSKESVEEVVEETVEEAEHVSMRYEANGGTSGSMNVDDVVLDGSEYQVPDTGFAREGYIFTGWSTTPDGKDIKDNKDTPHVNEAFKASYVPVGVYMVNLEYSYIDDDGAHNGNLEYAKRDGVVTLHAQWVEELKAEEPTAAPQEEVNAVSDEKDTEAAPEVITTDDNADAKDAEKSEEKTEEKADEQKSEDKSASAEAENKDTKPEASSKIITTDDTEQTTEEESEIKVAQDVEASVVTDNDILGAVVTSDGDAQKDAIVDALQVKGLNRTRSLDVANTMLAAPLRAAAAGSTITAVPVSELAEGTRTAAYGNEIVGFALSWKTPDTVDDSDDANLYLKPGEDNDTPQSMVMKLNYALAGEHDYEPGDISITLPYYLFLDRDGNKIGTFTVPYPQEPSKRNDFNWKRVGDYIVLTNTKRMSAATKGYIELQVSDITPHMVKDSQRHDYGATLEVVTADGEVIGTLSNKLTAQIDTEAKVTAAYKKAYDVSWVSADQIPEDKRVPGEEEYVVVSWNMYGQYVMNQNGTLEWEDAIPDEYNGFILGAETGTVFSGYKESNTTPNLTIKSAYPGSQFEPNKTYTFHNQITYKMTETDADYEDDPKLVTTAVAPAQTSWSWQEPQFTLPTGHFMVIKAGNDDDDAYVHGKTTHHKNGYSVVDIDLNRRGYATSGLFGIYNKALNDIKDGKDARISYTVNSLGYLAPWTRGEGDMKQLSTWNQKSVKMLTKDTGLYIPGRGDLKVHDDYEFVGLDFSSAPWIAKLTGVNLNEDGTFTARHAGDGTFEYTTDDDTSHIPVIHVEIEQGGNWTEYATVDYTSGDAVITLANGESVSGYELPFPEGIDNWRTWVETPIAAISYDVRPIVSLKADGKMAGVTEELFVDNVNPNTQVFNTANMIATDSENNEVVDIDCAGYDVLYGYTTDVLAVPSKTGRQVGVDFDDQNVRVQWTAKVEERTYIPTKAIWMNAVTAGDIAPETSGIWRDLLPYGMTPDVSTVKLRNGDKIKKVYTIPNYKGSERTLLVVEADLLPSLQMWNNNGVSYVEDVPTITFEATYPFDMMRDVGTNVHNVVSFESGNDTLGTVEGYMGETDNTAGTNNVWTPHAFKESAVDVISEQEAMNEAAGGDKPTFVYSGANVNMSAISAARTSLYKEVDVNNEGWWSTGVLWGEPQEERMVFEGGIYDYRLRMMSADDTISKDLIMYDSLDDFEAGEGNDTIDQGAPSWKGEFLRLDTAQLEAMGCAPVVYYSTVPNLQMQNGSSNRAMNSDLSNTNIWIKASDYTGDLSKVTAFAVDCSKRKDGGDFALQPLQSVVVFVHMKAPFGEEAAPLIAQNAHAYNNAYLNCTSIDAKTGVEDSDNWVRKDYTRVGLVENTINVEKRWGDDNDRDGIRPDSVHVKLLADGEDTGKEADINEASEWKASFSNLEYAHQNGTPIVYSIAEDEVAGYEDTQLKAGNTIALANVHEPERINITGTKTWVGDDPETRPTTVKLELYADGVKKQTKTIQGETDTWEYTFENLYKYRDGGTPIVYEVREVSDNANRSYAVEYDGTNIKNTYHPYGDLKLSKTAIGTTEAEANQEYEFTVEFFNTGLAGEEPLSDAFTWNRSDDETGTVTSGETVKLKAGQTITIKDIPEDVHYRVTENVPNGYTVTNKIKTGVIEPNKTKTLDYENIYRVNGFINLGGEKILTDHAQTRYQFRFSLYDDEDNLLRSATSGSQESEQRREDGTLEKTTSSYVFGALSYTQADHGKTYHYKVKETTRERAGYVNDETVYDVYVSVTDNGDGTLTITPVYKDAEGHEVDNINFTNHYIAEGGATFKSWKELEGRALEDGEFTFKLFDEQGNVIQTKTNSADGSINWDTIPYTQKDIGKTFRYYVREVAGSDTNVVYDKTVFGYSVTVMDNNDGTLAGVQSFVTPNIESDFSESASAPITVNSTYRVYDGVFTLKYDDDIMHEFINNGEVIWQGDTNMSRVQSAILIGSNAKLASYCRLVEGDSCRIGEDNKAVYTISYSTDTQGGSGTANSLYSMTYTPYKEDVTSWDENGAMPVFKNKLDPGVLSVTKNVETSDPENPNQKFHFKVVFEGEGIDENWTPSYAVTDATDAIPEDILPPDENGHGIVAPITPVIPGGGVVALSVPGAFAKTFVQDVMPNAVTSANAVAKAAPKTADRGATDNTDGADNGTDNADGTYTLNMSANDVYEITGLPAGTTYEVNERDLPSGWKLVGIENATGTIGANATSTVKVTNEYSAEGFTYLTAYKSLKGRTLEPGEFTFELVDENDNVVQTATNEEADEALTVFDSEGNETGNVHRGQGAVVFGPLTYTEPGTHTYTIREVAGDDIGVTYSDEQLKATVTVTDAHSGKLDCAVEYENGDDVIENAVGTTSLTVNKKVLSDSEATADTAFTFDIDVVDAQGNAVEGPDSGKWTVEVKGGESATVDGLPVGATYTITERSMPGWTLDSAEGATGTLSNVASENVATFTNSYEAEGSYSVAVRKSYDGPEGLGNNFTFELYDNEGSKLYTAHETETGAVIFPEILYTTEDAGKTYTYWVREVAGDNANIDYDKHSARVDVTVIDTGIGRLNVTGKYNATAFDEETGAPTNGDTTDTFNNIYTVNLPFTGGKAPLEIFLLTMVGMFLAMYGIWKMNARANERKREAEQQQTDAQ